MTFDLCFRHGSPTEHKHIFYRVSQQESAPFPNMNATFSSSRPISTLRSAQLSPLSMCQVGVEAINLASTINPTDNCAFFNLFFLHLTDVVTVMCFLYYRIWRETKKRQKDLPNLQAGGGGGHQSIKKDSSKRSNSRYLPPSVNDDSILVFNRKTFSSFPPAMKLQQ